MRARRVTTAGCSSSQRSSTNSFNPEHRHGVESCGSPGRDRGRCGAGRREQQSHSHEGERVAGADAEQQAFHEAREEERADRAQRTKQHQIIVDDKCGTRTPGLFAAGDVTTVPYKQITIAMGQGTIAALAAYEFIQLKKGKEPGIIMDRSVKPC